MSMSRFYAISLAAVVSLLTSAPALATDFTFTIPVNFRYLPSDVVSFQGACYVYSASRTQIGIGRIPFIPISGGDYAGDVTVQFNADPGRDPATAAYYQCEGHFVGHNAPGVVPAFYFENPTSPTFPLQAGAPFRLNTGNQPITH